MTWPPVRYTCNRCGFAWTVPPAPACPVCWPIRVLSRVGRVLRFLEYATRPPA